MNRQPIFNFDGLASNGLHVVPKNGLILIENSDGAGNPKLIFLKSVTNITQISTVSQLLADTNAWVDICQCA